MVPSFRVPRRALVRNRGRPGARSPVGGQSPFIALPIHRTHDPCASLDPDMLPSLDSLREELALSSLCHLFEAVLHPCLEEGFPRHQLHPFPSPIVVESGGRRLVMPEARLGCLFHLTRHSPLSLCEEEQAWLRRHPVVETLLLVMPVAEGARMVSHRTCGLQEAERLLLDLMEARERVLIASVSHRRRVHGQIVVRHQPVALLDPTGVVHWLHPAAPRFGLIRAPFPTSQDHRRLDAWEEAPTDWAKLQVVEEAKLPRWYHEAREALKAQGESDPVFDAMLDLQRSALAHAAGRAAVEKLRATAQEFLSDFERWFGEGGLLPRPGVLG